MNTSAGQHMVTCPTCAMPIPGLTGPGPACPQCALPAAGHAGYVVARIEATLTEFRADRDRLLASLRALAGPASTARESAFAAPARLDPPTTLAPTAGELTDQPSAPVPVIGRAFANAPTWPVQPAPTPIPTRSPRRRLSPQQLLLGTGVVLLVSAAIAFVAVAWESLGLAVQATVLVALTGSVCAASVLAARRGLRTTGEALAMAGLALTVVDLVAARVRGLAGLDQLPLRASAALTLGVVVILGLGLRRVAPRTMTWPVGALVAAQPLAFLALPEAARTAVPLVATALLVSAVDVVVVARVQSVLASVASGLAGGWWLVGTATGTIAAWSGSVIESVLCTVLVASTGAWAVLVVPRLKLVGYSALLPTLDLTVAASGALALAGTLQQTGTPGEWVTGFLGLAVLTASVLRIAMAATARGRWPVPAALSGGLLGVLSSGQLVAGRNWTELASLAALAAAATAGIAVLRPIVRAPAAALAALLPGVAVLLLVVDGLEAERGGWMLAVLSAGVLGLACARVKHVEERPLAAAAALLGLIAVSLTATTFAWGQLALQMSLTGAALLAYGRTTSYRPATLVGLGELVLASWAGAAGLSVTTPEVYTLPAAVGLLLASGRRLLTAQSWPAWGAPLLIALVPSTLLVMSQPETLRLVLLVAAATACAVLGTITHRQAPFLIGLGVLLSLAVTELGPYASLLPRWLSLGLAGIVLLALGATYERRLAQAREAIAWVGALR